MIELRILSFLKARMMSRTGSAFIEAMAVLAFAAGLAGCASTSVITESNWPQDRKVIDGFDISQSNRVLSHGLTQIYARALDEPALDQFILIGLDGLAEIDPLFSFVDNGPNIKTFIGTDLTSDLKKPESRNVKDWVDFFHGAVVGARRKSMLFRSADLEQFYYAFFDAALEDIDPYSRYAGRLQARANRDTRNGFGGMGMRYLNGELGLVVTGLQKNAPAAAAGLEIGDIITHIDGTSLIAKRRWTIRRLLRGPVGSRSKLAVIRGKLGRALSLRVRRSLIVPQTVETQVIDNVVIVNIHSFNQQTAQTVEAELSSALAAMPSVSGVILDLRGDPGGLLDQAVTVSDLFMETGRIVSTRGRHPESVQRYQAFEGDVAEGRPIIVMVDSRSASAAEIVAAAIQDSGRGLIVGTSSYGKGTVQTVIRLPNEGEITLTWSRFHAPDGYAIQDLGVLPFICTSGVTGSVEEALQMWHAYGSQIASMKAQWRTVQPGDIKARSTLRSQCPAEVRPESSIDLDLAKGLILDDILYAQGLGLTATTEAQND